MRDSLQYFDNEKAYLLFKKYLDLNPGYQRIINIYNFIYYTEYTYAISPFVTASSAKLDNKTLLYLESIGLLESIDQGYAIAREPRELILQHFSKTPEFKLLLKKMKSYLFDRGWGYDDYVREFRIALYSGDEEIIKNSFSECYRSADKYDFPISIIVFNSPFNSECIKMLPLDLQNKVLKEIISYQFENGIPGDQATQMLGKIGFAILEGYLLSTWDSKKIFIDKHLDNYPANRFRGIEAVVKRKFKQGYQLFSRTEYRYSDASMLFYAITLINLNKNDEIINNILDKKDLREVPAAAGTLRAIKALCNVFLSRKIISDIPVYVLDPLESDSILGGFVTLLCCYWLKDPKFSKKLKDFEKELEGAQVLDFYREELANFEKGTGIASLIEPIELWRSALDGLLNTFKNEGILELNQRLVWRAAMDREDIKLTALIQKKNKKGTWSQGRQIDCYNISKYYDTALLSKGDKELADIAARTSGFYYNNADEDLYIRQAQLLIDHPLVFDNNTKNKITIEEVPLKLKVTENRQGFVITFNPAISGKNNPVVKITGNTWQITFISVKQKTISRFIGKKLSVPKNQAAKLSDLFNVVEGSIPVDGAIKTLGKNLEKVNGNHITQIFIEPFMDGLHFKLRAVPSGDNQYFIPGIGKDEYIGVLNSSSVVVKRVKDEELKNAGELINSISLLREQNSGDYSWEFPDIEESLEVLEQLKNHTAEPVMNWPKGESLKISHSVSSSSLFNGVSKKRDWFEVSGEVQVDKDKVISLKQLMKLSELSKSRFIRLDNGEYISLTKSLKRDLDTLTTFSHNSKGENIRLHPLALAAMEESYTVQEFVESKKWVKEFKKNHQKTFTVPKSVKVELRDYQLDGYVWMMRLSESGAGALLADDMGLGKTVQAIVMLAANKSKNPSLIVVPSSLIFNWASEIDKFAPSLNVTVLGTKNREEQIAELKGRDILITSYGLIQRNSELFTNRSWSTMVLDEAQAVKNSTTKRFKAISSIPRGFTLMTTGTPIENHLGELWSLFNIILPGFLGSHSNFREKFQEPIEKHKDRDVRLRLKRVISPFILRRTKEEVLTELPAKTEINLMVEMGEKEKIFYEALRLRAIEKLEDESDDNESRFQILAEITKLRQACCHPRLIDDKSLLKSAKLELFTEKINELVETSHQALVFSQFVGHLKIIANELDSMGIPYFYLDGSIPAKKRGALVNGFQNGEKPLFLISLKAGGSGLNLTAADYVFHMDPWWNPAVEDQASDRAHRIGQLRPVTVYRLITAGSIEEQIISMHKEKRNLAESLLSDSATSLKLKTDELMNIIKGDMI